VAWSLVQQSAAQISTTAPSTNTFSGNSAAGNLLVAVTGSASGTAITAPTGWVGGPAISSVSLNETYLWYYPANPGGLASFAFGGPATTIFVSVAEFTCPGVAAVATTSDTGTATNGAFNTITVATGGTARATDLVIAGAFEHLASASVIAWTEPSLSGWPGGAGPQAPPEFAGLKVTSLANHQYAGYLLAATAAGIQSVNPISSVAATLASGWTGAVMTFSQPAPFLFNTQRAVQVAATR
jgi:hypothetical protein